MQLLGPGVPAEHEGEQRVDQPDGCAEELEHGVCREADDLGRQQRAAEREQRDGELLAPELGEVDVKRAGEQQEAEHAVEEGVLEVEALDERADARGELDHVHRVEADHRQRAEHRHRHEADGRGEAQEACVDPAEQRRQRDHARERLEGWS